MTNLPEHVKSQETFYAQACPDDVIAPGTFDGVYQGVGILVKHYRFATCQKSRIQDPVLLVEKNYTKAISLIIRSNVVQQRIATIVHTAHSRLQGNIICSDMYNSNIRRTHNGLPVQYVIKYLQGKKT